MIWKVSRLSRRQIDFLNIIEHLKKHDVGLFSYSDNVNASTSMEIAMLQMMGTFAELERNTIVENVKMGMTQRAKEGKWNGGSVLGYSSKNKNLIINESEATTVKYTFDMYVSGKGFKAIANQLNHEGYKTKRGASFSINSIRTIIMNPLYAGFIRFNQVENWSEKRRTGKSENVILIEGKHEPIISIVLWRKTQKIFKQKSSKPSKTFTGHFPLTTLLRCPKCGQGMIGHKAKKSKSSKEYIRYYGNFHYKGSAVCNSNLIRADEVELFVFNRIKEVTTEPNILNFIVDKVNEKIAHLKQPIRDRLSYVEEPYNQTDKKINKYLAIIEKVPTPPESVLDRLTDLDKDKKALLEQKKHLEYELSKPTIKEISFKQLQNILSTFSNILPNIPPEKQKDLLHSVINKITVNAGDSPTERSVKDIQLYFDASQNDNYVLTYGTVHPS
ncbi:recombinase family protein [Rummeliibacillus sp. BSL5]